MTLLLLFIALTVVNVILQTVKSIATVKAGKTTAGILNALAYGVYTIVIIYTMCDLPLWLKAFITAVCNFVGVYVVKLIEEKSRKDKLWKVEATICGAYTEEIHRRLEMAEVPHNYIPNVGHYTIFNCYCSNKEDSQAVKSLLDDWGAKYFVSETKML